MRIAVDDAGAGFASLRHIVRLSPDITKLDISLTQHVRDDPVLRALAAALAQFAHQTGTDLIAEGIETTADLTAWQDFGAHAAQGYLLARPVTMPIPLARCGCCRIDHRGSCAALAPPGHDAFSRARQSTCSKGTTANQTKEDAMPTTIQRRVARQPTRALTVALTLMIVSAAPAGATIVERDRYEASFSGSYNDCGFDVAVEGAASGHFRIRAGKGKTDTTFFLMDNFSYAETHTNVVTGASLTIEGHGVFNEARASHVEGNVFEFTSIEAGQPFVVYNSAGTVVLRDRGMVQSRVLFDTGGDDVPGGEVLDVQTEFRGPHPGADIDFCSEIIGPLIGS